MNKIIYLKNEVKLGDLIEINGMKMTVSQELIDLNPDKFEVKKSTSEYFKCIEELTDLNVGEIYPTINGQIGKRGYNPKSSQFTESTKEAYDRQELLKEAKRKYPVGTRFNSAMSYSNIAIYEVTNDLRWHYGNLYKNHITVGVDGASVYADGKWAKIVNPLFITEDGVDIYEGDEYWFIQTGPNTGYSGAVAKFPWQIVKAGSVGKYRIDLDNTNIKRFSNEKSAQEWLSNNKVKTLEDYENILCALYQNNLDKSTICNGLVHNISKGLFYRLMKENEPKLFYTKVLQLIADDLNGDWKQEDGQVAYTISRKYTTNCHGGGNEGAVYFKTWDLVEKASVIMGNELNYIYKQ